MNKLLQPLGFVNIKYNEILWIDYPSRVYLFSSCAILMNIIIIVMRKYEIEMDEVIYIQVALVIHVDATLKVCIG